MIRSAIASLWRRIPVAVRAVIVGTVILMVGEGVPSNLFVANRMFWPAVPWFAPLAILWLWLFWRYLAGRWWPRSTSAERRENLRARSLSPRQWRWALIAGGSTMMSFGALHFVAAHFDPIDYRGFYALFVQVPPQTVAALILVISAAAGIVEEAAYRGYMQGMIERRHGPVAAIIIVAIFFCLIHITSIPPLTPTRAFFIITASVNYSILALLTGSILPGLVIHAVGDAAGIFLLWLLWSTDGLRADAPLWLYLVESAILGAIAVWAFRKLIHSYRSASTGSSLAA